MADAKPKRRIKQAETVREKAEKSSVERKPRRIKQAASSASGTVQNVREKGRKEYHVIKLPDNKTGRFMTKPRRFIPRFFREAWAELKLVTWPNRRETAKFTSAVLIFALVFGALVAITDYGLDKIFRKLLELN